MYVEEKRKGINWGGLIKNSIIIIGIVLVIFLIIWLFTRNRSNAIDVDYNNNNNNTNETLINPEYYSEEFINNYRYFHDTAKEYFLISELPESGKTIKLTLKQLIDKNLVLPFGYQGGSCDTEKSYVLVKNDNGYYTMTTNLVCGKEIAQTNEELGCNQLCENGKCDKELITEYQFKQAYKATETTYSCPTGYTKTGSGANTTCVKANEEKTNATKVVSYGCPDGYTKTGSGSNTLCTKGTEKTINATVNTAYSCPDGYTKNGSGENTTCTKVGTSTINATVSTSRTCPSGYIKIGSVCYKTTSTSKAADFVYTYSCPDGYTRSGSGDNTTCTKVHTSTISATPSHSYTCSSGTLTSDNQCRISSTETVKPIVNTSTSCPNGYDKVNSSCVKYLYTDFNYGSSYNGCTGGQAVVLPCSTGSCTTTKFQYKCTKGIQSTSSYTCPSGYTPSGSGENMKCTRTITKTVAATYNVNYICHPEYTMSGSGETAKCSRTVIRTVQPTKEPFYYCDSGYTISGSKCYKTTSTTTGAIVDKTYSCPEGYTQDGSKCYKTTSTTTGATVDKTYSCPKDYTKNDNKCILNTKTTNNAIKYVSYTCKEGYKKIGNGSSSVCTKGETTSVKATKSTKNVTKYRYKWSKETSLSGWTKTGKTRQVEKN